MKALIVEDELLAAERLEELLKETDPGIQIAGKTGSIKETVGWLMKNEADLIFLDIQLSDGISFSIFEQIEVRTPVILTTAYDQYAIQAFKLNSISYLLKPVRIDELKESLQKYESLKSAFQIDFEKLFEVFGDKKPEYRNRFLVQVGDKLRKIESTEVAYFYAYEKAVYMRTSDNKSYAIDTTLDTLDKTMDPAMFFRINRKYIVNMDAIKSMYAWSRSRVKLSLAPPPDDDMDTIVSIDRSADFRKWMDG